MKLLISKILSKLAAKLTGFSRVFYIPIQEKRCIPWFRDNGDKTLRLDYDLDNESIVFDLGGYEGQWASDIFSMYCCYVHIFEPVEKFASKIEKRFSKNNKIFIHKFGLSSNNEKAQISIDADSSSIFTIKGSTDEIYLNKAIDFIKEYKIERIDLIKINIEGGEYELLEHLLGSGFIGSVDNIQVQFHDFVLDAESRMNKIQDALSKTHFLTYQYPFVWENWQIKNDFK
jgi:FkbM family methyltransferase